MKWMIERCQRILNKIPEQFVEIAIDSSFKIKEEWKRKSKELQLVYTKWGKRWFPANI